jgi:hypothetical protein
MCADRARKLITDGLPEILTHLWSKNDKVSCDIADFLVDVSSHGKSPAGEY